MHEKNTEPWNPDSPDGGWDKSPKPSKSKLDIATKAVWIVSIIEIVIFGFYAVVTATIGSMPPDKLQNMGKEAKLDPKQLKSLLDHQSDLLYLAIFLFITMIVPAIIMLSLNSKVRKGSLVCNKIVRVLMYIQGFILAVELLWQVLSGAGAGMIIGIIIFGGMLGILITASQKLIVARDEILNQEQ